MLNLDQVLVLGQVSLWFRWTWVELVLGEFALGYLGGLGSSWSWVSLRWV